MTPISGDRSRRDFLKLAGLTSTGVALAACGTPPAPKPKSSGKATSSRPVPRGHVAQVPREKTLILANGDGSDIGIANPYASGFNHQRGMAAMMEPLYFYSAFTGETTPWLADGDPTYSSDNTSVSIKIRQDASWSDGEKFDANDVVFTVNMLKDKKNNAMAYAADMQEWVKEAKASDDFTVHLTFTKPAPRFVFDYFYFKNDLGVFLVPEHIFSKQKNQFGFLFYDPAKNWPVVSGPYQVVDWTAQQRLLDRRDDWWAVKAGLAELPGPQRIIVVPFTDPTNTAQQLINNELDSSLDLRPPVIKQVVEKNPKIIAWTGRHAPFGYTDWWPQSMFFNCEVPPYNDPDIRRAVNHAINRQQIVDVGYEGAGTISELPFPNFPPLKKYLDACKPLLEKYPTNAHDLKAVDKIMTGKGYEKDGQGLWVKDGKRVDATIYGIQDLQNDYGAILAEQLRAAGFEGSLQTPGDTGDRMANGKAKLFLFGFAGALADPYPSLELMSSRHYSKQGVLGDTPSSHWKNKEMDTIIDKMSALRVGDSQELPLFLQAMEIYLRELPHTPIVQWMHRIAYNTKYWSGWPTAADPYLPGAFWFKTLPLELAHLKPANG